MGRGVCVRAVVGLVVVVALAACTGPRATPSSPSPSSSPSSSSSSSGEPPPTVGAGPASCPQPAQNVDDLRAEPVRSPWRPLPAGEGHGALDLLAVAADGTVWATRSVQRRTAAGTETAPGGLLRRDGTRWRTYPLPAEAQVVAIGALSADRAWAFGTRGDRSGLVATVTDDTVAAEPAAAPSIGLHGTAARGPWAVSGRTALHWDGSAWREHPLPAPAQAIGGEGDDIWTVSADGPATRWTGTAWQAVTVPRPGTPKDAESPRTALADVAVLGPQDVWAVGGASWLTPGAYDEQGEPLERLRPVALHWDGHAWRCAWGPPGVTFTEAEPDGRGGMWVLDSTRARLHHYAAGRWTTSDVPGTVTALAHRPGTSEVYAAGRTGDDSGPTSPALWMTG